jgi:threonyl-tRNA synthetase
MAEVKQQGKDKKKEKPKKQETAQFQFPVVDFIDPRAKRFEELKKLEEGRRQGKQFFRVSYFQASEKPISITLPDGKVVNGVAGKTSAYDVAKGISKGLAESAVVAKVNGELYDLTRPLEGDCKLELFKFDSEEGRHVFWHSSAHILGEALERIYGTKLCTGPPVEGGFFYDSFMNEK